MRFVVLTGFFVAALSSVATIAHAQAPGEVAPTPPSSAPPAYGQPAAPAYGQPAPGAPDPAMSATQTQQVEPMRNRFSVGVGFSAMSLSENETSFRIASIALRYRIAKQFEAEFELFGGRQTIDGEDGPLALGGGFLGGRYRLMPGRKWNGYLGLGIGQIIVEQHETTEEMLDNAKRSLVRMSGGLEHRWQRFSIGAELAISVLGDRADKGENVIYYDGVSDAESLTGVDFSLRAGLYF